MIAIFGGTFDPIHLGHLNMAHHCVEQLKLTQLYFMPNRQPAHKNSSQVSNTHKLAMLNLAIEHTPYFALDTRELSRQGASYTVLSLQELRKQHPAEPLLFLMGMDSFNQFDTWHQWQTITQLCHLLVYRRPHEPLAPSKQLQHWLNHAKCEQAKALSDTPAGKVYFLHGEQSAVSSSLVRHTLLAGGDTSDYLPTSVRTYIAQHQLYQPNE